MNQHEYDVKYGFTPPPPPTAATLWRRQRTKLKQDYCSTDGLVRTVERRVPVVRWLRSYDPRTNLPADVLAGGTVGIYNIPQGLAYSVLASLPPVYGLYASFFPPLFYFIFGSSFHSSIGVFSLTCLMVGHTRTSMLPDYANGTTATEYKGIDNLTPIEVIVALAFLTGMVQIVMAMFRLDFLTSYLSDSAVSGLNFGAACHALVAQFPGILGISIHSQDRLFLKLFYNAWAILSAIPSTNLATLIVSIITIGSLLLSKFIIEPKTLKKGIPFPTELIVLIVGTVVSRYLDLHDRWNVKIINHVPLGMPSPILPRFQLMPYLIEEAFSIAIVAFAVTVSMGKLFARKHRYNIDTNQELLSLGVTGCVSSFFSVFPTSTSLSRTLVNEQSGAKTQVSGLVSSLIILCVILFLGPLLEPLPMCILSCIVTVALRSLLKKIEEVPRLWSYSKMDVIVWLSTALITICSDLIEGLVGGMIVALLLVVLRTQWPGFDSLGEVAPGDFRVLPLYSAATATDSRVVRFDSPLIFTNVEIFKKNIRRTVAEIMEKVSDEKTSARRTLILDCSTWIHSDAMGIEAVKEMNSECLLVGIVLLFANLPSALRIQYTQAELMDKMHEDQFYPSIEEALQAARFVIFNGKKSSQNSVDNKKCET